MTAKNRKEAEPVFCQVAALRYAKVLSELGISEETVREAGSIFETSQELKAALVNPVITKETKHNIIDKVFPEDAARQSMRRLSAKQNDFFEKRV